MKVTTKPIEVELLDPPNHIPRACFAQDIRPKERAAPKPPTNYYLRKLMSNTNGGRTQQAQYWDLVQKGDYVAYPEWGEPYLIPAHEMAQKYVVVEEDVEEPEEIPAVTESFDTSLDAQAVQQTVGQAPAGKLTSKKKS